MTPTLLVAGATGNTGVGFIKSIKSLLDKSGVDLRILALTRSLKGSAVQELSNLPGIEWVEKDWITVDHLWLKEQDVKRIFIASHNGVSQFIDESLFLHYAHRAGVEYVVRISTTRNSIGPNTGVFYGRAHWALETMLESPELRPLKWTSLQPNIFHKYVIFGAVDWLKTYKETGEKKLLKMIFDEDSPIATIDGPEVGIIAAHLLSLADVTPHNGKKYVLVGPKNINGAKDIVKTLEKVAGTTVDDVEYAVKFSEEEMAAFGMTGNAAKSMTFIGTVGAGGVCSIEQSPTSPEVLELYAPKSDLLGYLEEALSRV